MKINLKSLLLVSIFLTFNFIKTAGISEPKDPIRNLLADLEAKYNNFKSTDSIYMKIVLLNNMQTIISEIDKKFAQFTKEEKYKFKADLSFLETVKNEINELDREIFFIKYIYKNNEKFRHLPNEDIQLIAAYVIP